MGDSKICKPTVAKCAGSEPIEKALQAVMGYASCIFERTDADVVAFIAAPCAETRASLIRTNMLATEVITLVETVAALSGITSTPAKVTEQLKQIEEQFAAMFERLDIPDTALH